MSKCNKNKIGKWYHIVKSRLETDSFKIKESKFKSKHNQSIIDIRNINSSLNNFNSVNEMINTRIVAENKLHNLYLTSARQCDTGRCSSNPITSIYLTFRLNSSNWHLVCTDDDLNVGLCGNPILHYIAGQLSGAIREANLLHEKSCCLAIHLGLTFIANNSVNSHANTLLINPKARSISHFEPQGKIINFQLPYTNKLQTAIINTLQSISKENGYKYTGYISPNCNFQDDNPEWCYLWTTWLELLVILNPWVIPKNIGNYLEYRYKRLISRSSRGNQVVMFAKYLRELI